MFRNRRFQTNHLKQTIQRAMHMRYLLTAAGDIKQQYGQNRTMSKDKPKWTEYYIKAVLTYIDWEPNYEKEKVIISLLFFSSLLKPEIVYRFHIFKFTFLLILANIISINIKVIIIYIIFSIMNAIISLVFVTMFFFLYIYNHFFLYHCQRET